MGCEGDDKKARETNVLERGGDVWEARCTDVPGSSMSSKQNGDAKKEKRKKKQSHQEGGWSYHDERNRSKVKTRIQSEFLLKKQFKFTKKTVRTKQHIHSNNSEDQHMALLNRKICFIMHLIHRGGILLHSKVTFEPELPCLSKTMTIGVTLSFIGQILNKIAYWED